VGQPIHEFESQEAVLPRVAFRLRIKPGKEAEYDAAHESVWPALLPKLKEVGISEYSIFRREQDLFLVMRVDDFERAWRALDKDPTNLKWQQEMARLFEPVPGMKPGEKFAMMKEVFYLE
jgi:L-rhamnose mutarotase